jgi:glycosyltransferase involved in cell wall biosynthesis
MGRLEKIKGFDLLLRAFALLPPGEAQLVIIGDGTERLNLEALAKELELLELVTFLGAQVDPFPFLLNGTIGVVPSEFEAFGNVIIEMFAAGLPVVCFDVELGPREIIRDGINGMLLKDRNESALAQALKRLIGDESLRVTLASNARADARNNYSLDRVASVYGHWLSSLGKGRIAASESARANVSL